MPNAFNGLGASEPYVPDYLQDEIQFKIDNDLRTIAIPADGVVLGVVGDKNVNHVNFQMPAWYNGFDMSTFQARINFIDAGGNANYYTVTDMTVMTPEGTEVTGTPGENDIIYFTWLVDSYATGYVGQVRFNVRLTKFTESTLSQAFNTQVNTCQVLEGIQLADEITQEQAEDLLFHYTSELGDITEGYKRDLEAKSAETLETIPDDYNSISLRTLYNLDNINEIKSEIYNISTNVFNKNDVTYGKILARTVNTSRIDDTIDNESGFYSNQTWSVSQGDVIRITAQWGWLVIYDATGLVVESSNGTTSHTISNPNAKYMKYYVTATNDTYIANCMITINTTMPASYTAYVEHNKIDSVNTQINTINNTTIPSLTARINTVENDTHLDSTENYFNKNDVTLNVGPLRSEGANINDLTTVTGGFSANQIWEVNPGDVIYANTQWSRFTFYDTSKTYLSSLSLETLKYTVPENAKYMRLSGSQNNSTYVDNFMFTINRELPNKYTPYGGETLKAVTADIAETVFVNGINIFDVTQIVYDKVYSRSTTSSINTTESSTGSIISTQLWNVSPGDIIYSSAAWIRLNFYNEDGKYIDTVSDGYKQHVVPENAKYMRYQCAQSLPSYTTELMISINQPLPTTYVPYGKTNVIDNFNARLTAIENNSPDETGIAIILMNYDQNITSLTDDNRVPIMETYGWKPTFCGSVTSEITKALLAKGWDLSTYNNDSSYLPADNTINNTSYQSAWDAYVAHALSLQEAEGFFNPVLWASRQNKWGICLENAVKKYGYKIGRASISTANAPLIMPNEMHESFTATNSCGIYSDNLSDVKAYIDSAITAKAALNVFTHYVCDTSAEDRGYDCVKSVYLQLMDYIKSKESAGLLKVMNYREYYNYLYPHSGHEHDYNRTVKRMNYIESNA